MLGIHLQAHLNKCVKRNVVELAVGAAQVEGNRSFLGFLVADDDNIGSLKVLVVFDLLLHILVGVISLKADAVGSQLACHLLCILVVLCADGNDTHLIRGEPEGERTLKVLDQDADKALQGTEQSAVNDHGNSLGAVAGGVGQFKVSGQLEVELDSAALPLAAQGILDLQVDLGTVESAVASLIS